MLLPTNPKKTMAQNWVDLASTKVPFMVMLACVASRPSFGVAWESHRDFQLVKLLNMNLTRDPKPARFTHGRSFRQRTPARAGRLAFPQPQRRRPLPGTSPWLWMVGSARPPQRAIPTGRQHMPMEAQWGDVPSYGRCKRNSNQIPAVLSRHSMPTSRRGSCPKHLNFVCSGGRSRRTEVFASRLARPP